MPNSPGVPPRIRGMRRSALQWTGLIMVAAIIGVVWFATVHRQNSVEAATPAPELGEHLHSLVVVGQDLLIGTHGATALSRDGGKTLDRVADLEGLDAMENAVSRDAKVIIVAGHDGARVSRDGGRTWADFSSGLPGTDMHGLAIDSRDPRRVVAYVVREGLYGTIDGGLSWKRLGAAPGEPMGTGIIQGQRILMPTFPRGLLESKDGGSSWTLVSQEVGGTALVADPRDNRTLLLSGYGPFFVSTNAGTSWSERPIPKGAQVVAVGGQGDLIAAGYNAEHRALLWRSNDETSWTQINTGH